MLRIRIVPLGLVALVAVAAPAGETAESWARWSRERAAFLERWGQYEEAVEEWMVVARLVPEAVEPYSRAAVLAVDAGVLRGKELRVDSEDARVATQCVQRGVLRGGQGDAGLAYAIGRLRFAEGRWGTAWKMLGDAKQWGFDPIRARYWYYRASVNRAGELVDVGRSEEAVAALTALLREYPGHPDERFAKILLAGGHRGMQEPGIARKILEEMLRAEPAAADVHYVLAMLLADQGQLDEAQKHLLDAMAEATATYADQTYRNALLKLCDLQLKQGRIADAEASAATLQTLAKDDAETLFRLARVKQAREDLAAAIPLYRRVVRLLPDSLETLANLQQALYQVGEADEADEVGRRAAEIRNRRSGEADAVPVPQPSPEPPPPDKR